MKRPRIKRKTPATAKRECDAAWRRAILARDAYACIKCGKPGPTLQAAHVRSRRYLSTRWMLENGMALCAGCHFWWHHEPLEAALWFSVEYPERANLIKLASFYGKPNLPSVLEGLRQGLGKYVADSL